MKLNTRFFNIINNSPKELLQLLNTPAARIGKKVKNTDKIGIEIELEKVNIKNPRVNDFLWKIQEDGSLKNRGKEFTICIYSNKVLEALANLKENLSSYEASPRTGIHIHLNIGDLSMEEILLFVYIYYIFETPLIKYTGGRFKNNFCVPLNESWSLDPTSLLNWKKYNAINVFPKLHTNPDIRLSTIEFRQMKGNFNEEYINTWVQLIMAMKIYVKGKSLSDFLDTIEHANSNSSYNILMKEIFKEYYNALQYSDINKDIESSILNIKTYLYINEIYPKQDIIELNFTENITGTAYYFPFLIKKEKPFENQYYDDDIDIPKIEFDRQAGITDTDGENPTPMPPPEPPPRGFRFTPAMERTMPNTINLDQIITREELDQRITREEQERLQREIREHRNRITTDTPIRTPAPRPIRNITP